jgi:hypothetical protein
LAEAVGEQFFRDVAVLLADFHVESFSHGMYYAGLGHGFTRNERKEQR